jgi:glucan phosphoethanolaminetransferase (alkaline phosphatase superfamily)
MLNEIMGWIVVIICMILSIVLLAGKGSFLIAGYNTAKREEKEKYNEKKIWYIAGTGFSIITLVVAINVYFGEAIPSFLKWTVPWGILIPIAFMIILANTIGRKK